MRRSKRRRPSRTRSQLAIPSRSARSAGVEPELGEPAFDIGRAHGGRPSRRMTWPAESSRDRRGDLAAVRRSGVGDARLPRRRRRRPPRHDDRSRPLGLRPRGTRPRRAPSGCFGSTDSPLRITRPLKSDDRTSAAILHVAADPRAARDDRALADDRDPGVEPARLLLVRPVVVRPVADDRALADDDLLVEDRPVDDGARAG